MNKKVRAAVVEGPSHMVIKEFDMPDIGEDDGLLKMEMAGICGGTDPDIYSGKKKYVDYPIILGHENIGRIAKVGNKAAKQWNVKEGDRVIVESFVRCGFCSKCVTGDYRFCENGRGYGVRMSSSTPPHLWGSYAEYMYLSPGVVVHKIPESIPTEAAILIKAAVSNAIRWGRLTGDFGLGDAVVIQGVGQQGLALVIVAKESGCNPIIVTGLSKDKERFDLAREFGADYTIDVEKEDVVERVRELTGGHMADVVIDVAGNSKAYITTIDLVKHHGTVVAAAVLGTGVATPLVTNKIVHNEIKLIGVYSSDTRTIGKAIKLVESGKYPIEKIVSHKFPLEQAEKALQTAGGYFKDVYPIKCAIVF